MPPSVDSQPGGSSVQMVDPAADAGWDSKIQACGGSSFFHSAAWYRVLHDTYGYAPAYFTLTEADRLRALLPVMEVDSWLTGRRGVSLPFTDGCEPVCSDLSTFQRVYQAALDYGEQRGWKYLECRGGRALVADAPASTVFYGHELNLAGNEESLFANVESAVRRAIRKAEKGGVSVEIGQSMEAVRIFYGLLCKTRKRHGVPPQPFQFFRNVHKHILARQRGFVVLAKYQGRPVAGAVFFHWGKCGIYKYGASDEAFQQVRANNLVMWEAIKWYVRSGFGQLNFGRTSLTNEGLRRFKLGWGTEEHMIEYVRYDWRATGFVTAADEAVGWHNRLFRVSPVSLSRLIGSALYKHVA